MTDSPKKKERRYPLKSDGSPEMIEYRNKVNTGEIKKRGRPFLTAEERAKSAKKRKEYIQTRNAKRKRIRRRYEDFYSYEEAREKIQEEGIKSSVEYMRWHRLNHPARMPQSPDEFYARRGKWVNWAEFLGVVNTYPRIKKKNFRPFKEAKAYAHAKGFADKSAWFAHVKAGNLPDDIPARPDVAYFKSGDWFSWRDFLGPRCKIEMGKTIEKINDKILYILNVPDPKTTRLYRVGLTVGGWGSIQDAINKFGVRYVDGYVIDREFDLNTFVARFGEPHWEGNGVYTINNISEMLMALSQDFSRYQKSS